MRTYRGARVVVLGAAGFMGRWVASALCAVGAAVHLVVRDRRAAEAVFEDHEICGDVSELDLLDEGKVQELFRKIEPAITFNLAGYGVDRSERDEKLSYEINASLVTTIGKAAAGIGDPSWPGQQVVHTGSALEYGTIDGDLAETSIPHPTTLYGQSKLAGTRNLAACCAESGLRGLTARLFMVYGPGEHAGRLLPGLLEAARTDRVMELTAGLQRRDFTYVKDVAEGLLRLGLCQAKPGEIVNLATGKLISIRHFTESAASILHISPDRLKFGAISVRAEEMNHSDVNIERLQELTSWAPRTDIYTGIRETVDFTNSRVKLTSPG